MAAVPVQQGSALAQAIQSAVQPKLMENGWVAEENDTTLSEYVTMMVVHGKDMQSVQAELGGELLGTGEDDPTVGEFARWLFEQVNSLAAAQHTQAGTADAQPQDQPPQPIPSVVDSQMEDASASVDGAPTGPKSMRSGSGRGRGGRMLGHMNRQMDRSQELPESLRRIKGAAGGNSGRINAHHSRDSTPRGPKNAGLANGVQRMMNGGGRGGRNNNMMPMPGSGPLNADQQMQVMNFMEMQARMMQMMQANGGQFPNMGGNFKQNGGPRGGRQNGHPSSRQPPQQHAVNGRLPDGPLQAGGTDSGMEVDGEAASSDRKAQFDTLCRFNLSCTNPNCGFAHQSPAAPAGTTVDLTDTCSFGLACANPKCSGRHPSPAQKNGSTLQVDCKFYPNCTNPRCPFRHPTEMPPCRNGADCTVPNCKFLHSKIMCRYNPCLNPHCAFKHGEGQKRGTYEDKVWTANGGGDESANGKSERFADFSKHAEGQDEELILPGGANPAEGGDVQPQPETQMEAQPAV